GGPFIPYAPPSTPAQKPQPRSHPRLSFCNAGGLLPINEYRENAMIRIPSAAFTGRWWLLVSNRRPSGMPSKVESTSHAALRKWISRQSCATTTPAMVIDTSTARGAATSSGMKSASNGTATNASPNPNADRIKVAANTTNRTCRVVTSTTSPAGSSSSLLYSNGAQRLDSSGPSGILGVSQGRYSVMASHSSKFGKIFRPAALLISCIFVYTAFGFAADGVATREDPNARVSIEPRVKPAPIVPAHSANIKVDKTLVLVNVTVTDPLNRFVTGLEKEHFRVFEDKVEQ